MVKIMIHETIAGTWVLHKCQKGTRLKLFFFGSPEIDKSKGCSIKSSQTKKEQGSESTNCRVLNI